MTAWRTIELEEEPTYRAWTRADLDRETSDVGRHSEYPAEDTPKIRPNRRKLSASQRALIRRRHARGMTIRALAAEYGVTYSAIWQILKETT